MDVVRDEYCIHSFSVFGWLSGIGFLFGEVYVEEWFLEHGKLEVDFIFQCCVCGFVLFFEMGDLSGFDLLMSGS